MDIKRIESDELEISIAGAGHVRLADLSVAELETIVMGSGRLELAGQALAQDLEISGSGNYQADRLISDSAYIDIRGSGEVEISVRKQLIAMLTRGADLVYHGSPELDVDINGRGKSRNAGNIRGN